jgi:hypothetical protein
LITVKVKVEGRLEELSSYLSKKLLTSWQSKKPDSQTGKREPEMVNELRHASPLSGA